jgi:hypothetical protein
MVVYSPAPNQKLEKTERLKDLNKCDQTRERERERQTECVLIFVYRKRGREMETLYSI